MLGALQGPECISSYSHWNKRNDKPSLMPVSVPMPQGPGLYKLSWHLLWKINPTFVYHQETFLSHRKLKKRQRNRLIDKEGEKCGTKDIILFLNVYSKGFFHISGGSFQWDDKLSAGICSKWISHHTPRNRGFRALAGKRAISSTGMSAVSNPPFELQNTVENTVQDSSWH